MMREKFLFCCLIALSLLAGFSSGTKAQELINRSKYYVDSQNGNDDYSGKSQKLAWRSLSKVNAQTFTPGDQVLFKRGGKWKGQLMPQGSGTKKSPIIFTAYGKGELPVIAAEGQFKDAVLLKNISNIALENLDLSNFDALVKTQKTGPTGVRILAENIGTISNIRLSNLYVHDINGDNKKGSNEGNGIFWDCQGPKPSNIENLLIENCRVVKVDRNGIRGNGTFAFRNHWFPNKNLIIRGCTLEDIGGDGIVVKAFDGSLIEHNKLFHIRTRAKDNAVGIWPHSSDNTIIQYNEVAFTKNLDWSNDGQSFDIDGNCNNTIIQNNYSHDNDGGFMLVISDAINAKSKMTTNSIIRNNLSINDGNKRKRLFNFALVTDDTQISNNIFYNSGLDAVKMELIDIEHGVPKNVVLDGNIFEYRGLATGIFTKSAKQYAALTWMGNVFKGNIAGKDQLLNVKQEPVIKKKNLKEFPWSFIKALKLEKLL
ncbi:right-handed parallel beta-helix repeat-containing protein [Pedobacter sp. N36a]|uniref:right-handed parallel beta-helix repeat-containing protein n=1 Tax=Pedobacter sp. N36a TaxID=2767996 RepID=UPI0016569AAA|nr:right-handed parallel beta-helix repeat-containing protein [Pedobacter sp. N36a]MBC8987311.1 right-handed parallel beta-helix repeat-containing protein [Pedobacter sp. N36a]